MGDGGAPPPAGTSTGGGGAACASASRRAGSLRPGPAVKAGPRHGSHAPRRGRGPSPTLDAERGAGPAGGVRPATEARATGGGRAMWGQVCRDQRRGQKAHRVRRLRSPAAAVVSAVAAFAQRGRAARVASPSARLVAPPSGSWAISPVATGVVLVDIRVRGAGFVSTEPLYCQQVMSGAVCALPCRPSLPGPGR